MFEVSTLSVTVQPAVPPRCRGAAVGRASPSEIVLGGRFALASAKRPPLD